MPDMRRKEARRFFAQHHSQPRLSEIAQYPGQQDDRHKASQFSTHYTRADNEQLQRHGNGHQRRYENREQPVSHEPDSKPRGTALRRHLFHDPPSAMMRRLKQNQAPRGRPDHRHTRANPRHTGTFNRQQYQQSIEYPGHRNSGRIEDGKQQNAQRPPGYQHLGKLMQQLRF